MSGDERIYKPSAHPDLGWISREAAVYMSAGSAAKSYAFKKKEAMENCEQQLGPSLENEIQNVSPNATNISR